MHSQLNGQGPLLRAQFCQYVRLQHISMLLFDDQEHQKISIFDPLYKTAFYSLHWDWGLEDVDSYPQRWTELKQLLFPASLSDRPLKSKLRAFMHSSKTS